MSSTLTPGDIVLVALPSNQPRGREQEGRRPAVVVGVPPEALRYSVIILAPLTTQQGEWSTQNPMVYPKLTAGMGKLPQESIVLLDQLRAIDIQRLVSYLGSLTAEQYEPIRTGLKQIFNL